MKRFITYFSKLFSPLLGLQSSDVSHDCRLAVDSPSGFGSKSLLKLVSVLALVMTLGVGNVWGAADYIIPKLYLSARNTPSGNTGWTFTSATANNAGTDYWKMVSSSSVVTSPAFDISGYTNVTVSIKWGSFGSFNATKCNATVKVSTGSGTWTTLGTTGLSSASTSGTVYNFEDVDESSSYSSAQIQISTPSADGSVGGRLYYVEIKGEAAASCTTSPTVTAGSLKGSVSSTSSATAQCTSGISSLGNTGCSITSYGFAVGTSTGPTIGGTLTGTGKTYQVGTSYATKDVGFEGTIDGLSAGTKYYVRPYATNGNGTAYGTEFNFTTLHEYTLTYKETNGTANGSGKVVENATSFTNTSAPSKVGHDLEGFYTSSALTTKVASNARVLVANIDGWTGAGGKYTKGSNADLYLKWTPASYTITTTLTSCSWSSAISSPYTYDGVASAITRTVNPSSGYGCPTNITVTMGGATLTKGTDYTWSVTNGVGSFTLTKVITGNVAITITAQPMVTWMAGGEVFSTQVGSSGTALSNPTDPSPATYCPGGKVFVGWSASTISGTTSTEPADLFSSAEATSLTIPAGGTTYYAVFATVTGTFGKYKRVTTANASTDIVAGTKIAIVAYDDNKSTWKQLGMNAAGSSYIDKDAPSENGSGQIDTPTRNYAWKVSKSGSYYIFTNQKTSSKKIATSNSGSNKTLDASTQTYYQWDYGTNSYGTNTFYLLLYNGSSLTSNALERYNGSWKIYGGSYTDGAAFQLKLYVPAYSATAYATTCCTDAGSLSASVTGTTHNAATVSWTIPVDGSSNEKQAGVIVRIYADNAGAKGDEITAKRGDYSSDNSTTSHEFTSLTPDTKYWWTIEGVGKTVAGTTYCDIAQTTPASFTTQPACDDYSFHYGTNGNGASWQILCFENVTSTSEWIIEDFTIPSTNHLYVGYQNDFKDGSAGNKLSTNSASANVAWTTDPTKGGGSVWQGQIHLVPYNTSANDLGNWGVGQATGATGTLSIWDNSSDKNLFVGFEPDGYGITFGGNSYAFGDATDHERETEVVTLPASLSTTYSVGLKTASGYVDCAHSNNEATFATMATTEVEGGKIKISMVPNSDWKADSPKFAIWDATHSKWGTSGEFMTKISDDLYEGYVSSGTSTIVIARIDPSKDSPDWSWNQTVNISLSTLNTKFTITSKVGGDGSDKDKYNVSAAAHNPTASAHGKFRMWDNNSLKNWCCHFVPYYKLTYNANGGSNAPAAVYGNSEETDNVTVNNGSGLTAPTGKHFVKWNTANDGSGEDVDAGDYTLTEDLEIFAIWEWNDYTVTVNKNGCAGATVGADKTANVHYGETVTLSADEPAGYAFVNWTTSDGVTFSPNATTKGATFTMPASNVTVQANYHQIYTITWKVNNVALTGDALDGADVNVEQGSNLANVPSTAPADNSLNSCANKFMGWSKKSAGSTPKTTSYYDDLFTSASEFVDGGGTITENTTFYAVFAERQGEAENTVIFSESFTGMTGTPSSPSSGATVYPGATITYTWTAATGSSTGNTQLDANSYAGGSSPEAQIGKGNTTAGKLTIAGIPSGGASALTVSYNQNAYSLSASVSGTGGYSGSKSSSTKALTSFDVTVGSGETFSLIFTGGSSNNVRLDDITVKVKTAVYANYVTQCADNQVRVTYDANGGSAPSCAGGVTTKNASYTVCSTEPTRNYYDFGGWNDGTSTYDAGDSYNLSANTTFTAQWTPTTYNITYELDGGTNSGSNPATYNVTTATITLQNPTRGHDRFEGWFKTYSAGVYSDQVTSIPLGSHGDITLYAKWTERHEIVFDADGATTTIYRADDENMEDAVAGQGSVPSDPDAPSACDDKVFVGWSESTIDGETDTEPADLMNPAAGTVDEDKHYYAVWADESSESGTVKLIDDAFNVTGTDAVTSRSGWTSLSTIYGGSGSIRFSSGSNPGSMKLVKTGMGFGTNVTSATITFKIKKYSGSEASGTLTIGSDWVNDNTTKFSKDGGVNKASSVAYTTSDASNWTSCTCNVYDINSNTEIILDGTSNQRIHVKDFLMTYTGTVYTYDKYATSCCATKITLSDPSITDASTSGSTITFDKSSPVYTCGGTKTVTATLTLTAGYQASALSFAVNSGTVSISPAISTPITSSQVYTLTFAEDQNATLTTTATIAAKPLNGITITPSSGEVYVGQYVDFTVSYDPADYINPGYTLNATPVYVTKESAAPANTKLRLKGGRGSGPGASITETVNETVTIKASGDNTKTASVNMTVNPLPRVHFEDLVHGKEFADVVATIVENALNPNKTTKTSVDWVTPNANTCEENHLHLVGWIREDWPALVAYLNGTGDAPTTTAIVGAGNDGSGNAYFIAAGASINVQTFDGVTFYAVWAEIK